MKRRWVAARRRSGGGREGAATTHWRRAVEMRMKTARATVRVGVGSRMSMRVRGLRRRSRGRYPLTIGKLNHTTLRSTVCVVAGPRLTSRLIPVAATHFLMFFLHYYPKLVFYFFQKFFTNSSTVKFNTYFKRHQRWFAVDHSLVKADRLHEYHSFCKSNLGWDRQIG